MDLKKDAYGQEVWAFFQGKDSYEVIERDDGFIGLSGGAQAYFADFKDWPKIQKQAIKFAKGKVLDIGAGAGRISLYLQKKGFDVTAIDNSPLAIKVCKKRGVKNAKVLPIEKIGTFKPNTFDTVVMFGNNFGLFGGYKKAKTLLKKLHKITSSSALILAESSDVYKTDDPVHLSYHKFNKKRGRMSGQLCIRVRFRNYIGDWFDYLLVSKKEMKEILKNTGWMVKKFIASDNNGYYAIIEKE
ncbi:class I SAM-dependent methyltransferase [Candidatus Woesearchaeota archaeon]|nr:class I SAM-dependent methyltransferase [Candidatus Woesearchaeota archaeon]